MAASLNSGVRKMSHYPNIDTNWQGMEQMSMGPNRGRFTHTNGKGLPDCVGLGTEIETTPTTHQIRRRFP